MKATSLNGSTSKKRPALRLVSTKELPREDWLQIRKQGIGSSDAAAAVGLNPYKSQLELWLEKTGRTGLGLFVTSVRRRRRRRWSRRHRGRCCHRRCRLPHRRRDY